MSLNKSKTNLERKLGESTWGFVHIHGAQIAHFHQLLAQTPAISDHASIGLQNNLKRVLYDKR